ncbi:4Fe-4S binding protein [Candidatus Woesearchaeota archaeon]|nr:4Fe-4S binding protein [Candidatus Woesearchaeota archaeon]
MSDENKPGWKTIPIGGMILEAGNAEKYKTGDWRTFRPQRDHDKCTNCMICFMYCPDSAIPLKDEKVDGFDYDHCKGCGICAKMCPVKCIEMKDENDFKD